MRLTKIGLTLGWLLAGACDEAVRADGGTVRLSRCEGQYRISIFTAPTPFRAGPVDISVLVQNAVTGDLTPDVDVTISFTPLTQPGQSIRQAATNGAATNKLLKAAVFTLPEPGNWSVDVAIDGGQGSARVQFSLMAASRVPHWSALWPWIGWPVPVVVLFSIHQRLVWRKQRRPA
jgi:hypothetical protein